MTARTNRGKYIDMDALAQKHEHTIAVTGGGTSMNARGDLIGLGGRVIKKVEQREKESEALIRPDAQKVKLADLRKFAGQVGESETDIRAALNAATVKAKAEARKTAKKVELATSVLANGGQPVIKDYTDQTGDVPEVKKPRRITDTNE